jgi:hypothetical protein
MTCPGQGIPYFLSPDDLVDNLNLRGRSPQAEVLGKVTSAHRSHEPGGIKIDTGNLCEEAFRAIA